MSYFYILILVLFACNEKARSIENTTCGDWHPFKEEKCLKFLDEMGLKTFDDAKKSCEDKSGTLLTIHFQEEQEFISEYLEGMKIANDVWIGVKYADKKYKWIDNTDIVYQNWAKGSPKNKSDHCVQFQSDDTSFGNWSDVLCTKKNLVVCQKLPTWSLSHLQDLLMKALKNPVPIGFTYVQLPKELSPQVIWPWMIWKDVSPDYAGVFFRVDGENAAPFGQIQNDNNPRLGHVDTVWTNEPAWAEVSKHLAPDPGHSNITIPRNERSLWIYTGSNAAVDRYMSFNLTEGEVRPRNMAIRVWRRMS